MKAKEFIPASKPRNPVVRQQQTSGAGAHRDKKKEQKQGYEKHKSKGVAEADKHSFIGKIQRGHELKKKVDSTWKDIGNAQRAGDKAAGGMAESEEGFSIEDMVMDQYRNGNDVWEIASNLGMSEDEVQDIIDDGEKGVAEAEKKPYPKTWHDVDPKLGKQVDKMSQAEKVKKGFAHPDTLKKKKEQGVAEGVSGLTDAEYNTVARYAKSKYPAMVLAALGRNPDGSVNVRMHDTKGLGITKEFKVRFAEPEETDIKEARRVRGGDYQLKLVDRQEDDDTDLDNVVTDYYFDVYQNGQKVGHAQGDSYHGELVVKVDFNREFKLDTYYDKDHPLIQQFEKIQQQGVAEGFAEHDLRRKLQRQIGNIELIDFYITDDNGLIVAGPFEGRSDAHAAFEKLVRQRQDINVIQGRALIVKLAGMREGVAEGDDLGHLDSEVFGRIDAEKKRRADLKKNDPAAYARELEKDRKNYGRGIMGVLRRKYDMPLDEFAQGNSEDNSDDLTDEAFKDGQRLGYSMVDGIKRIDGFKASNWSMKYTIPFAYGWNAGRKAKIAQARKDGVELVMKKDGSLVRGQGVAEGESALEKFRKAAAEREKKHADAEKEMKARHASGKEDMKGAIDRLEKHLKKEDTDIPFNQCPSCRGPIAHESQINEKQDACYHKVRSRYKVWPSAYASGALVQCRKKGASNWGNKKK